MTRLSAAVFWMRTFTSQIAMTRANFTPASALVLLKPAAAAGHSVYECHDGSPRESLIFSGGRAVWCGRLCPWPEIMGHAF